MERTRTAAVLTILGAVALLAPLASPVAADDDEALVPEGRCDVYRPGNAVAAGVDRCTTGLVAAAVTVAPPVPACPDALPVPADGGVAFYVGDCPAEQTHTTGAAATAEPAPAPPPAAPRRHESPAPAPTTTTTSSSTTSTTSTTFVVPPPPAPVSEGGASTARPATAEVVIHPAAAAVLTSAARPATVEGDDSPLIMLFALALVALVLLGISRLRADRA